jgi:hypothetical protein
MYLRLDCEDLVLKWREGKPLERKRVAVRVNLKIEPLRFASTSELQEFRRVCRILTH